MNRFLEQSVSLQARAFPSSILSVLLLAALWLPSTASGQEWARKMFSAFEHDFGTVARGSDVEYRFEIKNLYKEEIHIDSVTSSCGCTEVTLTKNQLKTWETAEIIARFNTRSFTGFKQATVTVRFGRPYVAEVQLNVRGNIRGDVVFEPGTIDFGTVTPDQTGKTYRVRISKFGNPNWRIADVKSTFKHVRVQLSRPVYQNNRIVYDMDIKLTEDAPTGYLHGELLIVADEFGRQVEIPITFSGKVVSPLQISPEIVTLHLQAGTETSKKIIVKADQPFTITDIRASDGGFSFSIPQGKKKLHLITAKYTAAQEGTHKGEISVHTDLNGTTVGTIQTLVEAPPPQTQDDR